ncbi:DUF2637 domain-containing protein [Actinoplanes sp. Pm04-4]|uniref:DUF2637 domain-containing protein n=1 Tax=Paractinoplanes pyxinae TaxID=2997416 RepID=A0ABT4BEJ8_9ACTN|nr:DUF2637 domain-containing protein [Actinoplanes pyxinae]MCY1144000.1 DUF2637 domain-containing protein [Actinoplanes pyxinae]
MTARPYTAMRWAVRATLGLGVTVSIAANVLHARDNPVSQAIAGWPPIALLLTVELISRIPASSRGLAAVRICATALVAGIAAWVSYWHMVSVAARYGETGASPYLLPLSVDGLVIVASICLVELNVRVQRTGPPPPIPCPTDPTQKPTAQHSATGPESTQPSRPTQPVPAPGRTRTDRTHRAHPQQPATPVAAAQTAVLELPTGQTLQAGLYQPVSEQDRAMYEVWLRATATGRRLSGADLARAAGRSNDNTGTGRRAARRYTDAHNHRFASTAPSA